MTSDFSNRPRRKLKCHVAALFLYFCASALATEDWRLLIEPKFLKYDVAWPLPGSKITAIVPARVVDGEPVPLKRDEVPNLQITRPQIQAAALEAATAELNKLTPKFTRDSKNVIQYALLESESPLTASAALSPKFAEKFAKTLGPDILVVIPNRYKIYVFPKLSPAYKGFADIIAGDYTSSASPVSREIFEWRNGVFTAIGSYR